MRVSIHCLLLASASFSLYPAYVAAQGATGDNVASKPSDSKFIHRLIEGYPNGIKQSLDLHDKNLKSASSNFNSAFAYIAVKRVHRWAPGQTIKVAFNGGDTALWAKIESAANDWTAPGYANLHLKFRSADGKFNTWNPTDNIYSAQIRVAFNSGDTGGYWSLVGTDSVDSSIEGGKPGMVSLNLDSFDRQLPNDWAGIVRHEFGHAIGLEHEHQSPISNCDFRFDDDSGYIPTKDPDGWMINDNQGRRPGLYTYLGGYANFWKPEKVDFNLKKIANSFAYSYGKYDKSSIMEYYFDSFMFKTGVNSDCYISSENVSLSSGDKLGISTLYPTQYRASNSEINKDIYSLQHLLKYTTKNSAINTTIKNKIYNLNAAKMNVSM